VRCSCGLGRAGFRQQACQSLTTRTHWFVVALWAPSCQNLDLMGDLPQHLADLGTVSRDVLSLRIGRLAGIDCQEFLTIEPVQPFGALVRPQRRGNVIAYALWGCCAAKPTGKRSRCWIQANY